MNHGNDTKYSVVPKVKTAETANFTMRSPLEFVSTGKGCHGKETGAVHAIALSTQAFSAEAGTRMSTARPGVSLYGSRSRGLEK